MFFEVFKFECRYQLRSALFPIVAAVFFLLAFLGMASDNLTIGGGTGNLDLNADFTIVQSHYVLSLIAMFAGVAFVATPITRDNENKTSEMFISTGVPRLAYLFGRFSGGFLFAFLAGCAAILGTLLATFMPWLDQERLASFSWAPYQYSILQIMLLNTFITGGTFFTVAALTRSIMAPYLAVFGLIIVFIVAGSNTDPETIAVTSLIDPFGFISFAWETRYWSVFEKNTRVPEFAGAILLNRLIWVGISATGLLLTGWRYRFSLPRQKARKALRIVGAAPAVTGRLAVSPRFDFALTLAQFTSQFRMDMRDIFLSVPFYLLLVFGMLNVVGGFLGSISGLYGTPVYPVTRMMLNVIAASFLIAVIAIVIYYSGELIHRERQRKVAAYLDAMPWPSGVMVLAKIAAMWAIVTALLLAVMLVAMVVQAFNGYFDFELDVYLVGLFIGQGWSIYLLCVVAVFIQVMVDSKFVGMLLTLVLFLGLQVMSGVGYEHSLYQFGVPVMRYSDLNGWGHFLERTLTVGAYWSVFCVLLVITAHLFLRRGYYDGIYERWRLARLRCTWRVMSAAGLSLAVFIGLGSWIYYNTNILNTYTTRDDIEELQADYEKTYKKYRYQEMPDAVAIDARVDIFPQQRRIHAVGRVVLKNLHDAPLDELHLSLNRVLRINSIEVPGASLVPEDDSEQAKKFAYYRYRFDKPLSPNSEVIVSFDVSWINEGFKNAHSSTRVLHNGTFVDNTEIFPLVGYNTAIELQDNNKRRKYGLPPVQRLPEYGDEKFLKTNQFGTATRADFHTVVSTSEDQTAISPGYIEKEWVEDGRRYFEYQMDQPIWAFVSYLSADYAVNRDKWRNVSLEVYHHEKHDYNVQRMIEASQKGLAYFSEAFSPYQYRQFRILEFPAYARFAQSFPNTIPFSEAIGFIADLRDPKDIDYVFYVTAHELAHQWWAHQVMGARMQGASVVTETLSQYSALMLMEHEYGAGKMRRFLKYELDQYLQSRGGELIEELPLKLVENQGYIHYRKGSLVMYALKDAIGEDAVNQALRAFIAKFAFKGAPFPTSGDLIAEFRKVAGPEHQKMITDLFEKIILFDLKVGDVETTRLEDGRYQLDITIEGRQLEADGQGRETEVPLEAWLDIGVFPEASEELSGELGDDDLPPPLFLERRLIESGENRFEVIVDAKPDRVGIDPYVKMIDRNPDDNLKKVTVSGT